MSQQVATSMIKKINIENDPSYPGLSFQYYPKFLDDGEIQSLYDHLSGLEYVPAVQDMRWIGGDRLGTKKDGNRNYYHWVADNPQYLYGFTQKTHLNALVPYNWTQELEQIRKKVESCLGLPDGYYNAVLVNYYPEFNSCLSAHRDDDQWLGKNPLVASVSLGAVRTFKFTYDRRSDMPIIGQETNNNLSLELESGSLAVMKGVTQEYYKHQLMPSKKKHTNGVHWRYNLTFRRILPELVHLQRSLRDPEAVVKEQQMKIIPKLKEEEKNIR